MQKEQNNTANVKQSIPYGGIKEIASRSKTSIYTVSRVLNGKSNNRKVLNEIKAYLDEFVHTRESINNNANLINTL